MQQTLPQMESELAEIKLSAIVCICSVLEMYTNKQLIFKLQEMKNEHEYLSDAIGRAETELFYRANPECRGNMG